MSSKLAYKPGLWLNDIVGEDSGGLQSKAPFHQDHVEVFQDRFTRKLVCTSQPYFPVFGKSDSTLTDEQRAEERAEDSRFRGMYTDADQQYLPEHVDADIARLRRTVGAYAAEHNLDHEVTFEGSWYYPGKSVLIVLREK